MLLDQMEICLVSYTLGIGLRWGSCNPVSGLAFDLFDMSLSRL